MSPSDANLNIALSLRGTESEDGFLRLDDLLKELRKLISALEEVDKAHNQAITLYYRVVNLSRNGAFQVAIEPILKNNLRTTANLPKFADVPRRVHHGFFETISHIENDQPALINGGEPVIDAIAELVSGLGQDFAGGEIANSHSRVQLNTEFKSKVDGLLKAQHISIGSVSGKLLALNLAHGNKFYIYPQVGPKSIACILPHHLVEEAKGYIKQTVRVYGKKCYRSNTGLPFRIMDVTRVVPAEKPTASDLEFIPRNTLQPEVPAHEAVRQLREGW